MKSLLFLLPAVMFTCAASPLPAQFPAQAPTRPSASPGPATARPLEVTHFDLSDLRAKVNLQDSVGLRRFYDEVFLVTSLQGLVNRDGPRLTIRYNPELDDFWWKILKEPGRWMERSTDQKAASLPELLKRYRAAYQGLVVYDESVPATSNVAATVAGADNLLVVRYDLDPASLYKELTTGPEALPVKMRLINEDGSPLFTGKGTIPGTTFPTTGSRKNDAYRWLIEKYLKAGKLDPTEVGYVVDAFWLKSWQSAGGRDDHNLNNLDYFIAKKEIVFDLDFAQDESPVDDPTQVVGSDFATIDLLFKTLNQLNGNRKIIQLHGFVPWPFKYSNFKSGGYSAGGRLEPVPSEWRFVEVTSAYNVLVDADPNNLPNASFTRHFQAPTPVRQLQPPPSKERLIKEGVLESNGSIPNVTFYAHYAGDYDSAAWVYRYLPAIWSDAARGELPVSWAINPNLDDMVAPYMYWIRTTAKGKDDFVAGDSGAGYVNPYQLSEPRHFSGLPSGVALWEAYNGAAMKRWDLDVIGFVIDGNTPFMKRDALDAYARVATGGIGTQVPPPTPVHEGMPMVSVPIYLSPNDGNSTVEKSAQALKQTLAAAASRFVVVRSILWKPSEFEALEKQLDRIGTVPRRLVDLRTLLWLQRYKTTLKPTATRQATNSGL